MKLLHVYSGNLFGGVESLLLTLARNRALCPEMEPRFALCFEGALSRGLRALGIEPVMLGVAKVSKPWTLWRGRRRLAEELRRERPDAVICHSAWAQALFGAAAREAGVRQLFWLHDAADGRHWLERWAALSPPDAAICNSRFTRETLPELFPRVPASVIYCPVSAPGRFDREELRRSLGIAPSETVVIQASRLEEWKGHRYHLRTLGAIRELPGWVSLIVGGSQRPHEAEYLESLRALARELGIAQRVRFLGQRPDVPSLLAASDIHFQPNSGPEPFGIAFVEALYAGLPVLTTAMGGALEIVTPECGKLVAPGDFAGLEATLRELLSDPGLRARLGAAGPERARALCDPAAQLRRLREFASAPASG
ncbi:MAG: glycosyltransferase [Oligoflexia bacterium]|nr:glycosyltransferase [Oligoflexia bacterium]